MNPDEEGRLAELLAGIGPLLLDFDGPVCSIFAGYPAPQVADELRGVLRDRVTDEIAAEPDPLEVLRWVGRLGDPALTQAVEDALRAAELRAVQSAEPTPYGREVIVAAREVGKPVGVVSNNSAAAVREYLDRHRLDVHVESVVGRAEDRPELMKPHPDPIRRSVAAFGAEPGECVLIGDSLADITAAQAAKVKVIGYANRPAKVERFPAAGADAVVTSMGDIAACLARLGRGIA
jgi:HAD superfamily hydrolase (TIGR01509 family)